MPAKTKINKSKSWEEPKAKETKKEIHLQQNPVKVIHSRSAQMTFFYPNKGDNCNNRNRKRNQSEDLSKFSPQLTDMPSSLCQ